MFLFKLKNLLSIFLLVSFNFCNHFAQSPAYPYPYDDALLPFGSPATGGRFSSRCSHRSNSAGVFRMLNNCSYTVWAAAVPGGGRRLGIGEVWVINPTPNSNGRVWGRTKCSFNSSGNGVCETGDCGGRLECQGYGEPPVTLAEFSTSTDFDFFDISLVDGFNIPMEFSPTSNGCNRGISCAADINGQCPAELKADGGCNNACSVFNTPEYCCTGTHNSPTECGPTDYSKFFKDRCPDAFSYVRDDKTSTFTCPRGTNYDIVFCP